MLVFTFIQNGYNGMNKVAKVDLKHLYLHSKHASIFKLKILDLDNYLRKSAYIINILKPVNLAFYNKLIFSNIFKKCFLDF